MPVLPAAKSFHRSVRALVAGSASVRPGLTRLSVSHWKVADVLRELIAPLARGVLVAAAVAQEPQVGLGLRLLRTQRQAEAGLAERLDLGGVGGHVGPGLRGRGDAGLLEQRGVVEQRAGRRGERDAVLGLGAVLALGLAELGHVRDQVAHGLRGDDVRGLVQQALRRDVGVAAALEQVRGVVVLHRRGQLGGQVVPGRHLQVDLDVRVLGLEVVDDLLPVQLGVVLVGAAVVRGEQRDGHRLGGGRAGRGGAAEDLLEEHADRATDATRPVAARRARRFTWDPPL